MSVKAVEPLTAELVESSVGGVRVGVVSSKLVDASALDSEDDFDAASLRVVSNVVVGIGVVCEEAVALRVGTEEVVALTVIGAAVDAVSTVVVEDEGFGELNSPTAGGSGVSGPAVGVTSAVGFSVTAMVGNGTD